MSAGSDKPLSPASISDATLVQRLRRGNETALTSLMQRYDALVRYAILRASRDRCRRDPEWLDSLASETWSGLIQSLRAPGAKTPKSIRAYLVQVARNRCISALKANPIAKFSLEQDNYIETDIEPADDSDPALVADRMEELETLRGCLAELTSAEKEVYAQLPAITERRWTEAAVALGVSESTLRSRWQRILAQLQRCVARKSQNRVAPEGGRPDN